MRDGLAKEERSPITADEWGPGYRLWQSILGLLAQRGPEGTTSLVRMSSHLLLILVAVAVLWLSRVQLPAMELVAEAEAPVTVIEDTTAPVQQAEENAAAETVALVRAAIPNTLIPDRPRLDIITHTVKSGDTLYGIAQKYKLNAETIMFANGLENNPDLLRLGQALTILPVDGILHTVKQGDTLDKIAKTYKATAAAIVNYSWNKLNTSNPTITAGQKLIVPGGRKEIPVQRAQVYSGPVPANAKRGTGRFVWPTSGYVTQGYKSLHRALDIALAVGTPVKAADSGYVVVAGWSNAGYGNYIVIDHGNGYQTLYAHLSKIFVSVGQVVAQGTVIGNMGNTGRSTGPHLHFEIRKNGVQLNPLKNLP